jgi:hypothetical protein
MAEQTARDRWMGISQLKELERQAGIDVANAALGEPRGKFEAERQYKAGRRIVFAIPDVAMRRQVIRAKRDCHRLCYESGHSGART